MERTKPIEFLKEKYIQENFGEYLKEFSKEEIMNEFFFSENEQLCLYNKFLAYVEEICLHSGVQYGSSKKALRFFKDYSKQQLADLMLIQEKDTQYENVSVEDLDLVKQKEITARLRLISDL